MKISRRTFLASSTAVLGVMAFPVCKSNNASPRSYQVCLSVDTIENNPELLATIADAGCKVVWIGAFFYGYWPVSIEKLVNARKRVNAMGMEALIINIPLGHPGDSLGSKDGDFPLTPPMHWKTAVHFDGHVYSGTSLHKPATSENVQAVKELKDAGFSTILLDDDFRLATGPGQIGGCYCDFHRDWFLNSNGYAASRWNELLNDAQQRRFTPLLRSWVDFTTSQLTDCFNQQQQVIGEQNLGIMVMYLGSEKAGIALDEYTNVPFRVGELMFDDKSFARVKGKTDELYSALFHRRFTQPELAWSETTAFPHDNLSAKNVAAKLTVSTIADVRNTCFMSGMQPYPISYWETLKPAMQTQSEFHSVLAEHKPQGPFKHWRGLPERYVGKDKPFSQWLATGVPFELCDNLPQDGWTFLSEADAVHLTDQELGSGTRFIAQPAEGLHTEIEQIKEALPEMFALKARILPQLKQTPFIVQDIPAVCAWYPTAKAVLVWNLTEQQQRLTVQMDEKQHELLLGPLESGLVRDLG